MKLKSTKHQAYSSHRGHSVLCYSCFWGCVFPNHEYTQYKLTYRLPREIARAEPCVWHAMEVHYCPINQGVCFLLDLFSVKMTTEPGPFCPGNHCMRCKLLRGVIGEPAAMGALQQRGHRRHLLPRVLSSGGHQGTCCHG